MIVIPAIDLRGGKAVRLLRGDFAKETVYSSEPLEVAKRFHGDGARRIHVVDLEGALHGKPKETALIGDIVRGVDARFQVGGGVRDAKTIDAYLKTGVWRVIVGTRACLDKGFLKEILRAFGSSVILGIDAVNGQVATDGWTKVTSTSANEIIGRILENGGEEIVYTDIAKDGALQGPNVPDLEKILNTFDIRVIASGGVSKLDDLKKLAALKKPNLVGAIVGRAIYEGTLSLKEAIAAC